MVRIIEKSTDKLKEWLWTCEEDGGVACESNPILSQAQSRLDLPPGTLSVGRYRLTVNAKIADTTLSVSGQVVVVEGDPPLFHLPLLSTPVNPTTQVTIHATEANLLQGCLIRWESLPLVGYTTLNTEIIKTQWWGSASPSQDCSLALPLGSLRPGASYSLRLSAFCNAARYSSIQISFTAASPPKVTSFLVWPLQGEALKTKFLFSTNRTEEYPATYSFGYYINSGPPLIFHTSAYWTSTHFFLPALSTNGSNIQTVLKICRSLLCSSVDGPIVQTSLPVSISPHLISVISKEVTIKMVAGDSQNAVAYAISVLSSTRLMPEQTVNEVLSKDIIDAMLKRILDMSQRLKQEFKLRPQAMALLESLVRMFPVLQLNDSALSVIVDFRDQIATTNLGRELPLEPRSQRSKRQHPIPPDTLAETPETVGVWLQTSETAILSFSKMKSEEEKLRLVGHLENYISGLCKGLSASQTVYLSGQLVNLSVQRLSLLGAEGDLSLPSCSQTCTRPSAQLYLGRAFVNQYRGVDSLCLAGLLFPSTFLDSAFVPLAQAIPLSEVYCMKVRTYSPSDHLPDSPIPNIVISIPLNNLTYSSTYIAQCFIGLPGVWTTKGCENSASSKGMVMCACQPYSCYSVFAIPIQYSTWTPGFTEAPTLSTGATSSTGLMTVGGSTAETVLATRLVDTQEDTSAKFDPPVQHMSRQFRMVAFRISEPYSSVGENNTEFSKEIRTQLRTQLNLPEDHIQDLFVSEDTKNPYPNVTNGHYDSCSILVTLVLKTDEGIGELSQALIEGQINLQDLKKKILMVPRQPLQVLRQNDGASHSGLSAVFLGSATISVCILVMLYILLVVFVTKHTRRNDAVRIFQRSRSETEVPRYLPLPQPRPLQSRGFYSGEDFDSGIYDAGGTRRNY